MFKLLLTLMIITVVKCCKDCDILKIPDDFLIGAASSAYQVKGAWNISEKTAIIGNNFAHQYPKNVADGPNADVTSDSYHKYEEEINILGDLGVDYYRFSISWSRLLPKGHSGYVSKSAVNYYHKLLDALEREKITPFVIIYHWDHPQLLEKEGGWLNNLMPYLFADYAKVVFDNFGHRVKYFITLNEPSNYCTMAYRQALHPPAKKLNGAGDYKCLHNQLKANALAYHIYNETYRRAYNGQVGIAYRCMGYFSEEKYDSISDDLAFEFDCGWQAHPIFSRTGGYPEIMKKKVAERSRAQGYNISRLPVFSKYWIERIKGTADFLGLNYYTSNLVKQLSKSSIVDWPNDEGLEYTANFNWISAQSDWLKVIPQGLTKVLRNIKEKYNNPTVYLTENEISLSNKYDDENMRIHYLNSHLRAIMSAINHGCNVKSYTYSNVLDSYEWFYGFAYPFGITRVDFNDINLTRTPKKCAVWFKNLVRTRKLESSEDQSCCNLENAQVKNECESEICQIEKFSKFFTNWNFF